MRHIRLLRARHILSALLCIAVCLFVVYILTSCSNGPSPASGFSRNQTSRHYRANPNPTLMELYDYKAGTGLIHREPNYGMIVWLDAGHGGIDSGTRAMVDGEVHLEKDIVLNIVLKAYEIFGSSDSGIKAFLTRTGDTHIPAAYRPYLWNGLADLVVSVHVDYFEGPSAYQVCGVQVNFYDNGYVNTGGANITSAKFAQIMQDHLVYQTGARDRNIRGDRSFAICAGSTIPVVLVEAGFMSNPEELALLITAEYQWKIAMAIYYAVVEASGFIVD